MGVHRSICLTKLDANELRKFVPGLRLQATVAFAGKKSLQQLRRQHFSVAIFSVELCLMAGFSNYSIRKAKVGVQENADGSHLRSLARVAILLRACV